MTDKLVRAVTHDGAFRAIALDATEMVQVTSKYHAASTLGLVVLGRALIGGLLLSNALLKGDERLVMTINGGGPIGKVVVETSAEGHVRGYVENPTLELPLKADGQVDVAGAVGTNGFLTVTKDMGEGMAPFNGQVELATGEIGDDIAYYLAKSEQIPSAVALTVDVSDAGVEVAGGFMVSALPDATEADIMGLETKLQNLPAMNDVLGANHEPFDALTALFGDDAVKLLEEMPVVPYPENTKMDYTKMLATLPVEQLTDMLENDHGLEVVDRFTGNRIQFSEAELAAIIAQVNAAQ
ncbi:Hsp33 family molecular chaperone HslO [Weissella tructae]|uniref:33 kDa chaperonin n=2 Tax=Weissella TaxID=46255 RepID=A0A075TY83_9LACO|nr:MULTISPECIES: Hsp33 family molecular chaperone HslO [Weissella]AIG65185.1 33 kDa chaperonin [Weissella tructae]AIM62498.1 33 kDa chaperonin [Weissella ceti]AIM63834.1 33 kDa chaperonin [Weissella ceti]ELA07972.1 disulfide bond chaperones of the HSP33 family protein [Weissella ceti NC36]QVV91569.1 Hsp33 family molecular chaperone HslO [Weissella tructae]